MSSEQIADTHENGTSPSSTVPGSDGNDKLDRDELFEVLGNRRRQYVLHSLERDEDDEVDFSELVTRVAALENDVPVKQVDYDERKSVYVGLRQTHLPKMDEYNLIEYDRDRGTVELDEAAEEARMYLEYVPKNDIPWAYHYLGVSAVMSIIIGLTWQGIFPFEQLHGMAVAVIAVAVLGLSSVVHSIYTRRNRIGGSDDSELFDG